VPMRLPVACLAGGLYKVQTGDNFWSVAKKLTTPAHKVTAYDLVKYNYWADPQYLKPESTLIVPFPHRELLSIVGVHASSDHDSHSS